MLANSATRRDQRVEFHRLEEADQPLVVGIVHRDVGDRHVQFDVIVEGDELLRQPGLVGMLDQALAAFLLLDLAGALQQRLEVAEFANELRCGLDADAGDARHIVGRIADQGLDLDHLVGGHAELLDHLGNADAAVLHGVVHHDAVIHELHQVLVGRHDGGGGAGLAGLPRIGRDQVVGFEAALFDRWQVEGAHRRADKSELRNQVARRIGPMRLVVRVHVSAERLFRLVEHDREVGRLLAGLHIAQQLPQHVAEAEDGVDLQSVRLAAERRQRVIGAEDVARAIDQEDVIARLRRAAGHGRSGCALGAGIFGFGGGHVLDRMWSVQDPLATAACRRYPARG